MTKIYTPKTTAIVTGRNYSITKPTEPTEPTGLICNANKTNEQLNISQLYEMISKLVMSANNTQLKVHTDSTKYCGFGISNTNMFSVNVCTKRTKPIYRTGAIYRIWFNDCLTDVIPKKYEVRLHENNNDKKTRPHLLELVNNNELIECVNIAMNYFKK